MDIGRVKSAHQHTTGVFYNILPLLVRYSALTQSNNVTLYKSLIRSILTYAAPVWSSTSSSSYLRLHVIQSNCLRGIGIHPRCTSTSHLHNALNIQPIRFVIHLLTDKYFAHYPSYPNPPSPTNMELRSSRPD